MKTVIGLAGTAKNTGKTTTMNAIMENAYQEGITVGLTSIGYDGEEIDSITGLPKPRIKAREGMILAVADSCLQTGSVKAEILRETSIRVPLGTIVIARVVKSGLVVLAGPNKSSELRKTKQILAAEGCKLVLVDGALNRLAPMVETDGLVIATGAARSLDIQRLASEAAALEKLLALPLFAEKTESGLTVSSLLNEDMVKELLDNINEKNDAVFVEGLITEESFRLLLETGVDKLAGKTLVLTDAIKLLITGSFNGMLEVIAGLKSAGIEVAVKKKVKLLAFTVNPFYPNYRVAARDYEPAYVDRVEIKAALEEKCNTLVFDVQTEGGKGIWRLLSTFLA